MELDPARRIASRNGRLLRLSAREFAVLEALMRAAPSPLRADELLKQVWHERVEPFSNAVAVTISRLRRKLGEPAVIFTSLHIGYHIDDVG